MYSKKKLKDFLTLGTSNLIANIIPGLFWLFIASITTKQDYGEIGYLISFANVGFVISLIGLQAVIPVYEPKKENVFPASFVLVLLSSGIIAVIVYVLTQNTFASILILGLTILNIILSGLLSKQRYRDYSKHILIKSTVSVVFAILFYYLIGINGILLGYFVGCLIILSELRSLIRNKKIEFSILRSKIKFMLASQSSLISETFFKSGDKLLIGALFGFTTLGGYYFAAQYLFLLTVVPTSLFQYLLPQESEGKKNKKIKIFSILIASLLTLVSIMAVPFGITTFLPTYEESILPIQIMSVGLIPMTIIAVQNIQFLGKENSLLVFIGSVIQTGLYLVLIILLGQYYGLIGFAVGFVVSTIIRTIFNQFAGSRIKTES